MKKALWVFLLLVLIIFTGCYSNQSNDNVFKEIDGVLMVSAKDVSRLLGLTFVVENDNITLRQDDIILKLSFSSPYVYKGNFIIDILEKPSVKLEGRTYIPLSFFTDYLKASIKKDEMNQLSAQNNSDFSLYNSVKFLPEEVLGAINDKNYPYRDKILKAVELPRSMNIETPKINMEKVIVKTPLDAFNYDFKGDLRKHGYSEELIANFSYNDYKVIESKWKLPEEMIISTKGMYPELKHEDLSNWTYGDKENYSRYKDKIDLENRFTEEQRKQLKQRGILLEDAFYLLKDFYRPDTILAQSDNVLKKTLEGYYQLSIDMLKDKK